MANEPEDDSRFMTLFERAMTLPPEARPSALAATSADAALVQDVLELAARHDDLGRFLLDPLVRRGAGMSEPVSGRFRIVRRVGEGGMAIVYEAIDTKLNRRCALKYPKPGHAGRLPPEATHAYEITDEHVCRVYGIHTAETEAGPIDVLAMEFLDGETLSDRLARPEPLSAAEKLTIARQICAGLSAAHRKGVLHRDLKSNNVMLVSSDGGMRAVITDFGLAKHYADVADHGSAVSAPAGAVAYMAPERLRGEAASRQSDIYALGVMLHELVTGRLPESPGSGRPATAVRTRTWERAIRKCLAPSPDDRAQDVDEIVRALDGRRWRRWPLAAAISVALLMTASGPQETVRLAILPLAAAGGDAETQALAGGVLHDLPDRLQRIELRARGFSVIPPTEAARHRITTSDSAWATLRATHALSLQIDRRDDLTRLDAVLYDARTGIAVRTLAAEYPRGEESAIPMALTGLITASLRLTPARRDDSIAGPAQVAFLHGVFHLRSGLAHADAAIASLEEAVRIDPQSPLARAALAEAYAGMYQRESNGKWLQLAQQSLDAAKSRDPDLAAVHIASGRMHRILGMYDRAVDDLDRATEVDPDNVVAWVGLARAYEAMGTRPADAAAAYQKAIDLDPEYYLPQLEFANFYYFVGDYTRAEEQYLRTIAIAPQLAASYTNLGGLYADMGRYSNAERMLRRSLTIEESTAALTNLGAVLNYQRRDREALDLYRQARQLGADDFVLMVNIGDSARRLGLAGEAADAYREGLKRADEELLKSRGDSYARAFVGYFYAVLGQPDMARREIEQALRFEPGDAKIIRCAVLTYAYLHDRQRTLQLLTGAPPDLVREISRHPDLSDLHRDPAFQNLLNRLTTSSK